MSRPAGNLYGVHRRLEVQDWGEASLDEAERVKLIILENINMVGG
jgi:hypothetical protein